MPWVSRSSQNSSRILAGHLRRNAAQFGQLLGQPLHIHLRQGAQNLFGRLLAHGHQQNRSLAHPAYIRRQLASLIGITRPKLHPFPLPCSTATLLTQFNRSESSFATAGSFASAPASNDWRPVRRSPAPEVFPDPVSIGSGGFNILGAGTSVPAGNSFTAPLATLGGSEGRARRTAGRTPKATTINMPANKAPYFTSTGEPSAVARICPGKVNRLLQAVLLEGQIRDLQEIPARGLKAHRRLRQRSQVAQLLGRARLPLRRLALGRRLQAAGRSPQSPPSSAVRSPALSTTMPHGLRGAIGSRFALGGLRQAWSVGG